jgi:hypothetical protein
MKMCSRYRPEHSSAILMASIGSGLDNFERRNVKSNSMEGL